MTTVNEKEIPQIPLTLGERAEAGECERIDASLGLKSLAQHFTKGINRFTVDAEGTVGEVVLEIEL